MSSAKQTQMFIFPAVNYNFNRQKLWSWALKSSDRCLVPGWSHGLNLLCLRAPKLIHDSLKPLPPLRLVSPTRHMSGSAAKPMCDTGAQGQLPRHIITLYRVTVISPPPLALSPAHLEASRRTRNRNHTISCNLPHMTGMVMPRASALVSGLSCPPF